jgi:NADPH:quinone reductase-like Zn-dependent oxidoreductase
MTAGRIHRFGPPEVIEIEQIPIPQPGEGEVLLRIEAAGVGPWDGWIRPGHSWLPQPLPLTLGSDIAGIVEHVGLGVTAFKSGDAVFGVSNARFTGGYAEFSAASAMMLARRPENLSALEAASVPVVAVTALQMLFTQANVEQGQTVLIHGAAGNVGAYAVQLAHWKGCHVVASIRRVGRDDVQGLGAERVIDTATSDLQALGPVADAVIDTVGDAAQSHLLYLLKPGGILVSSAAKPDENRAKALGVRAVAFVVDVNRGDLQKISSMFETEALRADVGAVLPLEQARTAHEMLEGKKSLEGGGKSFSVSQKHKGKADERRRRSIEFQGQRLGHVPVVHDFCCFLVLILLCHNF